MFEELSDYYMMLQLIIELQNKSNAKNYITEYFQKYDVTTFDPTQNFNLDVFYDKPISKLPDFFKSIDDLNLVLVKDLDKDKKKLYELFVPQLSNNYYLTYYNTGNIKKNLVLVI